MTQTTILRNTGILYVGQPGADLLSKAEAMASEILNTTVERLRLHPDYAYFGLDADEKTFGVDKAKLIIELSYLSAAVSDIKVIVIDNMDKMTLEAQNKLLKTLEEANVVIIGLAYEDNLIPTVKSRMRIMRVSSEQRELPLEVKQIFENVLVCLENKNLADYYSLLAVLNLVKEKDPKSFFAVYRDYVPELIDFFGEQIINRQLSFSGKSYKKLLGVLYANRIACMTPQYTKDDFFVLIVQIIENL